jgi:malate dehydrogenase (oxaloacetate-decarboxylating)(NADP+)
VIPEKTMKAVKLAKAKYPDLILDGDIQANVAFDTDIQQEMYPFSALAKEGANTLIFPNLAAGNIAYKLLIEIGGAESIGPILLGMKKPVHVLQLGSSIREIVNMAAIAVVDAQLHEKNVHL